MTELQQKFIWLAFADKIPYTKIEKVLGVTRKDLSAWTKELEHEWRPLSAIKSIHGIKKISIDFKEFYTWYKNIEHKKHCEYCKITESQIEFLLDTERVITKRNRGRKLELDRKEPNLSYDNLDNIVFACYWCNNAKTDTFTHQEFLEVGKVFGEIWKERMLNDYRQQNK
jgi:hypothetical protein